LPDDGARGAKREDRENGVRWHSKKIYLDILTKALCYWLDALGRSTAMICIPASFSASTTPNQLRVLNPDLTVRPVLDSVINRGCDNGIYLVRVIHLRSPRAETAYPVRKGWRA
jgi:hypothetical protein